MLDPARAPVYMMRAAGAGGTGPDRGSVPMERRGSGGRQSWGASLATPVSGLPRLTVRAQPLFLTRSGSYASQRAPAREPHGLCHPIEGTFWPRSFPLPSLLSPHPGPSPVPTSLTWSPEPPEGPFQGVMGLGAFW